MRASAAVVFAVLSSFVGNAFAAPESYRVFAYPKSPITTFRTQLTYANCLSSPTPSLSFSSLQKLTHNSNGLHRRR